MYRDGESGGKIKQTKLDPTVFVLAPSLRIPIGEDTIPVTNTSSNTRIAPDRSPGGQVCKKLLGIYQQRC